MVASTMANGPKVFSMAQALILQRQETAPLGSGNLANSLGRATIHVGNLQVLSHLLITSASGDMFMSAFHRRGKRRSATLKGEKLLRVAFRSEKCRIVLRWCWSSRRATPSCEHAQPPSDSLCSRPAAMLIGIQTGPVKPCLG